MTPLRAEIEARISEIEKRLDAATPGPWYNFKSDRVIKAEKALTPKHQVPKEWNICKYPMRTNDYPISHDEYEANAALIANAPSDLRYLLSIAKAAMGLRDALETYSHCHVEGNAACKALTVFEKAVRGSE